MNFLKIRSILFALIVRVIAKLFFVDMPPVISVMALIRRGDALLFQKLSYKKGYGVPGGLVKGGESAEEALRREVKEETNLEVAGMRYLGSVDSVSYGIDTLTFVFETEVSGTEEGSPEGELFWLSPEEVKGKLAYASGEEAVQRFACR